MSRRMDDRGRYEGWSGRGYFCLQTNIPPSLPVWVTEGEEGFDFTPADIGPNGRVHA